MNNPLKMTGIDHPSLAANDVEQLADWYCEVFGYEKWFCHQTADRQTVGTPKSVWMLKAPDGTLLEVMPKDDTIRPTRTTWTPGWSHLALRVENIDEAIVFLDTKNVRWGGEVINAIGGGKVRNLFDPDGNMLQILERMVKGEGRNRAVGAERLSQAVFTIHFSPFALHTSPLTIRPSPFTHSPFHP